MAAAKGGNLNTNIHRIWGFGQGGFKWGGLVIGTRDYSEQFVIFRNYSPFFRSYFAFFRDYLTFLRNYFTFFRNYVTCFRKYEWSARGGWGFG